VIRPVLDAVRSHLGNDAIRVPSPVDAWSVASGQLVVDLQGARLGENIQRTGPSIPSYVVALCYWYEVATGERLNGVVRVVGSVPDTVGGNRARFMLTELSSVLGDRLRVEGMRPFRLPDRPVMNAPTQVRSASSKGTRPEHQMEVLLTQQAKTPMGRLRRQFPLGLFDGKKSSTTRVFPGGAAQADLWSYDAASRTLNLVELKVGGNATVGVLPEAFTYARLLQRFALHPHATWSEAWDGSKAAQAATRVVMWLVGEQFHPLVWTKGDSPLAWLNGSPRAGALEFRVVRFARSGRRSVRWSPVWPAGGAG